MVATDPRARGEHRQRCRLADHGGGTGQHRHAARPPRPPRGTNRATCARPIVAAADEVDPERAALIADSVGLGLLIVLETLTPAERLAFVLHDIFDVPFDQIAPIIDRSPRATRQIASRARRRIRTTTPPEADIGSQWELVGAFPAAARNGDFDALLEVLDPDVIRRVDAGPTGPEVPRILRGAHAVATGALAFGRLGHREKQARANGAPGIVTFADGRPYVVLGFTVAHGIRSSGNLGSFIGEIHRASGLRDDTQRLR